MTVTTPENLFPCLTVLIIRYFFLITSQNLPCFTLTPHTAFPEGGINSSINLRIGRLLSILSSTPSSAYIFFHTLCFLSPLFCSLNSSLSLQFLPVKMVLKSRVSALDEVFPVLIRAEGIILLVLEVILLFVHLVL